MTPIEQPVSQWRNQRLDLTAIARANNGDDGLLVASERFKWSSWSDR